MFYWASKIHSGGEDHGSNLQILCAQQAAEFCALQKAGRQAVRATDVQVKWEIPPMGWWYKLNIDGSTGQKTQNSRSGRSYSRRLRTVD